MYVLLTFKCAILILVISSLFFFSFDLTVKPISFEPILWDQESRLELDLEVSNQGKSIFKVRQHTSGAVSRSSRFLAIYNMILVVYISTYYH